jgi:hypothetical protein
MTESISTAHESASFPAEARALEWLAGRIAWERMLDELRAGRTTDVGLVPVPAPVPAAARTPLVPAQQRKAA